MKALILSGKDQPLRLQDRPIPVPGNHEALVRIHAAALNHRDLWIRIGRYAGLKYPIIPGSDGAGIVEAVGDARHADWIGKEVILYPVFSWGDQESHQHATQFRILGLPDDGTFTEYLKIPVNNLIEKPRFLSFEEAAALPLAGLTAFRSLFKRGGLIGGEKLLITGIGGGVALFALQFALAAHAEVYMSSGSREKLDRAMAMGASGGANYRDDHWVEQLKEKAGGLDLIVDGAAGNGLNQLLDLAAPGSRLVLYGATKGNPEDLEIRRIFWKQLNVMGSTMGSPEDFQAMIDWVQEYRIHPVIDQIFPMEQGEAALQRMQEAQQFGKIVLKMN